MNGLIGGASPGMRFKMYFDHNKPTIFNLYKWWYQIYYEMSDANFDWTEI